MILDTYNQPKKLTTELLDSVVAHASDMLMLDDLDELQ